MMMMILTNATKMKRVVVRARVAAQSAPFQRKTTLSVVLHHHHRERVFSFSLSLSLLLLFYALESFKSSHHQPTDVKEREENNRQKRGTQATHKSVFRVSYKP